MTQRYLISIANDAHAPGEGARLAGLTGLAAIFEHPRLIVLASGACGQHPLGGRGVVLGTLFWRHGPACPIERLADSEIDHILADPAGSLLSRCWGGYVCAAETAAGICLLRDPSGSLPCYYADVGRTTLIASDLGLLLGAGCPGPTIDWLALGRHHFSCGLPTPDTALDGVKELMPGCSLDLAGAGAGDQRMRWSPWDHVEPDAGGRDAPLEEKLRRVVTHCTLAWASPWRRLIASVSGGLDSSIVAASLARSGRDLRCVTMYTDDPAGDERQYAQALCAHLGLPLVALPYLVDQVDICRPFSPHLPRPIGHAISQAFEQVHLQVAEEMGAEAFVTGAGGDNVFGYSQSAAAIVDRWRREGAVGALRTVRDVGRQTGCGSMTAIGAAIRVGRRARFLWSATPEFLHRDLRAAFGPADLRHPWLEAGPRAFPGKAAHIASLLRTQLVREPPRSLVAPVLYPLLSQPVIECCLRIPSWEWRKGGVDRAVARRGFAAALPDLVVRRRVKGGPDGFAAALMRRHHVLVRERLLDGELARQRVVDCETIATRLADPASLTATERVRIFELLDTEAWVQSMRPRCVP